MAATLSSPRSPVRTAAREVLDPDHLRSALRISPADATVVVAVRCGAAVGVALLVAVLAGRPDLAGFASLGALAGLYGRFDPYRRRATLLAVVGGAFVLLFGLVSALAAAGVPTAALFTLVALVAGLATAACRLVRVGAPGATIAIFVVAGALSGTVTWHDAAERTVACAVGAGIAWLVVMSGYLVRPSTPARLAVRRATDAVRGAVAGPTDDADRARHAARAAVDHARDVLADDASRRRTRPVAEELAGELSALDAVLDPVVDPVIDPVIDPAFDPDAAARPAATLPPRTTLRDEARAAWRSPGWRLSGVRVAAASVVAAGVAAVAGLSHPAWAQMGATATLQGTSTRHYTVRALQRGGGTVVGALVAWPLLAADLGFAETCVVVVVLQVVTEIVVGRHYGLAMITITPMALLMTSLGSPLDPAGTAAARALDTLLGVAVGVLAAVLVHARRVDGSGRPLRGRGPRASR